MSPEKRFDLRIRIYNPDKFSPTQTGTVPEKLLAPKFNEFKLEHFFKVTGNSPEKSFLYKYKASSLIKDLIEAGILLNRLLCPRLRTFICLKCRKQSGSCPVRKLSERSRNSKNPSTIWHEKEIPPQNLFLERFNDAKVELTFGIGHKSCWSSSLSPNFHQSLILNLVLSQ